MDEAMKDTQIGQLPMGWDVVPVARLGDVVTGSTPPTKKPEYYGGPYRFIAPGDLGEHCDITHSEKTLSEAGLAVSRCLPRNSVLVVCIGATIGKTGMTLDEKSATNQQINSVIPNNRVSSHYLYYALTHRARDLPSLAGRAAVPIVNKSNFSEFVVPLPPLPEQRVIAHVLRMVQRAKEATEKAIAAARQLKQSLMRHLFTYGPVPFDQAEKVELRETPFGPVPEHWSINPLDECAIVQTGVAKGKKYGEGDDVVTVPYLRVANVQDGYLDLSEIKTIDIRRREFDRYALQVGDVLLTEGGDFDKLGRGFIWNGEVQGSVHQNHIFAVRANRRVLLPDFLAFLTQSPYGKAYFLSVAHRTTHLACINTTKLKALPLLLPSLVEQKQIVEMLQAVDHAIACRETRRNALDALFNSLLHHLMTGKVRVHELGLK
jgi:type I restriction enzyme S subunit